MSHFGNSGCSMPDLSAPAYWLSRLIIERGIAAVYCVAFVVALKQFPALCGDHGLTPARVVLERSTFLQSPSLFHLGYSDRRLRGVAWAGIVLTAALVLGLPQQAALPVTMTTWFVLWVLYQSIVNVGRTFYSFGWETLLLEAGFLAIFLGNANTAPQVQCEPFGGQRSELRGQRGSRRREHVEGLRASVCVRLFLGLALVLAGCRTTRGVDGPAFGEGMASYYGPGFQGRPTASGEKFDKEQLTAAHRTLPFGTCVDVTSLRSGRSVRVRINDRGPYAGGRIIDLSEAAARELGLISAGVGRVRLSRCDY